MRSTIRSSAPLTGKQVVLIAVALRLGNGYKNSSITPSPLGCGGLDSDIMYGNTQRLY